MTDNRDELDDFYEALKHGLTVQDFLQRRVEIFRFVHLRGLTDDYRMGKGRVKRLRDEVTPVARLVGVHARPDEFIRFALDNSYPDCIVCGRQGRKREIEITVARAEERVALMETLSRTTEVRGIINLPDGEPMPSFRAYAKKAGNPDEAEAYSTEQLTELVFDAVEKRAKRKAHHQADTLLIEVMPDMYSLADNRWRDLQNRLFESAELKRLSCSEAFLVGYGQRGDICLKIK